MRTDKNFFWPLLLLCAILSWMPFPAFAQEDLQVESWKTRALILPNGDLEMQEVLTYRFKDSLNGIYRSIGTKHTAGIEDLQVGEQTASGLLAYTEKPSAQNKDQGVYQVTQDKDQIQVKVFAPSKDTTRSFVFSYTVRDAVRLHQDTAQLYYQFIGPKNETPVKHFKARIVLPNPRTERVELFAYGPAQGISRFEDESS